MSFLLFSTGWQTCNHLQASIAQYKKVTYKNCTTVLRIACKCECLLRDFHIFSKSMLSDYFSVIGELLNDVVLFSHYDCSKWFTMPQ